ncbi:hypothetical protein [Streptomyces sp. ICC4]|uniref:hypothetical protein n=1 Tax=Streptomyces sp. ICC4 TaxID=2099584 RepID=UPI0013A6E681|nr:hypothetical protein [Streptomyces sp. ICC4]
MAAPGPPWSVTAAQQDPGSRQRSRRTDVWQGVEVAYRKRLIEQNAEVLTLAGNQLEERMRLAAQLPSARSWNQS